MEHTLVSGPGFHRIVWASEEGEVTFEADRLREHSDGRLTARVGITLDLNGAGEITLFRGQLNLTALRSRTDLARTLEKRPTPDGVVWDRLIEESAQLILRAEERGFKVERLTATDRLEPEYLLEPVILARQPSIVFSAGGSGKSYFGLFLSLLLQNGLGFGLEPGRQANVLFLDYETSREETGRRCTLLAAGLEQRLIGRRFDFPLYGRGVGTLADRTADVARRVAEHDIGLVIVDSIGAAAGGDILAAETAVRFFEALRQVTTATDAASLCLTHVTKMDARQDDSYRAPFGSVYFTNLARLVFELRAQTAAREDELVFGLFSRKANAGHPPPLGFRFTFEPGAVVVDQAAASDVATEGAVLQDMILAELERGPARVGELAEATGASDGAVRVCLTRLKQSGRACNPTRGRWVLTEGGDR